MSGPWGPTAEMKNMFNWGDIGYHSTDTNACPDDCEREQKETGADADTDREGGKEMHEEKKKIRA